MSDLRDEPGQGLKVRSSVITVTLAMPVFVLSKYNRYSSGPNCPGRWSADNIQGAVGGNEKSSGRLVLYELVM